MKSAMDGTTDQLNEALKSSAALYKQMATAVQQGIQAAAASNDMTQLKNTLTGLDAQLEASITSYSDSATKLTDAANSLVSAVGTDAGLNAVGG